jgi:hypothetical protein
MIWNSEKSMTVEGSGRELLEIIIRESPGGTEKNHETSQDYPTLTSHLLIIGLWICNILLLTPYSIYLPGKLIVV